MLAGALAIAKRQRATGIANARPARSENALSPQSFMASLSTSRGMTTAAVAKLRTSLETLVRANNPSLASPPSAQDIASALTAVGDVLGGKKLDLDFSDARVTDRKLHLTLWVDDVLAWSYQFQQIVYGRGALATVLTNLCQPDGGLVGLLVLAVELSIGRDPILDEILLRVMCDDGSHFKLGSLYTGTPKPIQIGEIKIPLLVVPKNASLPIRQRGILPAASEIIASLRQSRGDIMIDGSILDPSRALNDALQVRLFTRVKFRVAEHDKKSDTSPRGPFRRAVLRRTDLSATVLSSEEEEGVRSTSAVHRCFRPFCTHMSHNLLRCGKCKSAFYCGSACQRLDWARHRVFCDPEKPRDREPLHTFSAASGEFEDLEAERAQEEVEDEDEEEEGEYRLPRSKPLFYSDGKMVMWKDPEGRTRIDWMARFETKRLILLELRPVEPKSGEQDRAPVAATFSIDSHLNENEDEPEPRWRDPEYLEDQYEEEEDDDDEEDDDGDLWTFEREMDMRRGYRGHSSVREIRMFPPAPENKGWMPVFRSMLDRMFGGLAMGSSAQDDVD